MKQRYSEILQQNIDIYEDGVLTEDKTPYTRKELNLLLKQSPEMLRGVHKLKKIFEGEVVK